ncbi:GNAT family N-acetyltransferase [Litorilituus sediminis]|uniref:N-acetyltransferase n=1 Tax=Litorilituus sediminis TaxID=718192 RepID=A0A4P6PBP7_9GAMM|nr:GNAT family N-acetyltransferase [Litorilituus sediminis]QBG37145.1 N-acetyltransferase [Litorilituus sediminis]
MSSTLRFSAYRSRDKNSCLALFDENCPKYFAANEREDYENFLDTMPEGYQVCTLDEAVVGAFGILGDEADYKHINWILISPKSQGLGIGAQFMKRAIAAGKANHLKHIKIAASHLSAPFFAKFGAIKVSEQAHGWGQDMHRIDMELAISG